MAQSDPEHDRIMRAVAGDQPALERLLVAHSPRLLRSIAPKVPADLRAFIAAEDILQEALAYAFQSIGTFEPRGPGAFYGWLAKIADLRVQDAIKRQRAKKRGGGRGPVELPKTPKSSSVVALLDLLAVSEHTPSRSAARHEAACAIHVALAGLKDDYREAVCLRYIEGLPVADVAEKMNRSKRSVQMLCYRGLKEMRAALGRASKFLSRT